MTIEKEAREIVKHYVGTNFNGNVFVPNVLVRDISKALQKKQDRIEELEKALNITMCVYCGFTAPKDANVIAKHIIEDCEKRPDSLVNMTKVLEDFKGKEARIEELESALRNCLATLKLCESKKDYLPFSYQFVFKSIELAKKAIGGGK